MTTMDESRHDLEDPQWDDSADGGARSALTPTAGGPSNGTPSGQARNDSPRIDPTLAVMHEIETRHEIDTMLAAGLNVATVYSLLCYQAELLILCRAAMPYAGERFHPLVGLLHLRERLRELAATTPAYPELLDPDLVDGGRLRERATDIVFDLLRSATLDEDMLHGFDAADPKGVDWSFAAGLARLTDTALGSLPAPLLLVELGKIVVPALIDLTTLTDDD